MEMVFKITSSSEPTRYIPISEGCTIGQSQSDIEINDPELSSPHAVVEKIKSLFVVRDKGSKSGVLFEGDRVSFIVLEVGVEFQIGHTKIEVLSRDKVKSVEAISKKQKIEAGASTSPSKADEPQEDTSTVSPAKVNLDEAVFLGVETLKTQLRNLKDQISPSLHFLSKPIHLTFERGLQKDLKWSMNYLPREVGSEDPDLPILDPKISGGCFKILWDSEKNEVCICAQGSNEILLNYQRLEKIKTVLKNKDLIILGSTYIRVSIGKTK